MKYLKEGKWEDFRNDEASHIFKRLEDIKAKYKSDIYTVEQEFIDINERFREEIAQCMVDLEDYLVDYHSEMSKSGKTYVVMIMIYQQMV